MELIVWGVLAAILFTLGINLAYRNAPYRELGSSRPKSSFLPKYRCTITSHLSLDQMASALEKHEFKSAGNHRGKLLFTRGSVFGDFSINRLKVKVGIENNADGKTELTVESYWAVMFDTGDFWDLTNLLVGELNDA